MKVLLLAHKIPYTPLDGGSIAIYNTSLGLIENGIEVEMLAVNPSRERVNEDVLPEEYKARTNFCSVSVKTNINPLKAFVNLFKKSSYFVERFNSKVFTNVLIKKITSKEFDIIQLEHLYMCLYIETIRKFSKAKIVLRTQNVEHEIWEGYLRNTPNSLKKKILKIATIRLKQFEISAISKTDGIIAITPKDANLFKQYNLSVPVISVPVSFRFEMLNGYDFDNQYETFPGIYHLGSMDWRPNEEAINWFIEDVFPMAVERIPDIKIYLAGKKMPQYLLEKSNENLFIEGTIEDAIKFQEDKAIMLVPLLSGSGIRAKIVEGMALGKTIISTSVGAMGIAYTDNENILIADSPEEFVLQIEKCIKSKQFCRKIGNNAKSFAMEKFRVSSCAKTMIDFYDILN